jgi:hypothetical protein
MVVAVSLATLCGLTVDTLDFFLVGLCSGARRFFFRWWHVLFADGVPVVRMVSAVEAVYDVAAGGQAEEQDCGAQPLHGKSNGANRTDQR